ncbi:LpxI family protein [Arvimicrobium flavum]|uniref:LpxI family protein n=1 Tax=Arvimicrobium flavum TaxID=3393320 RepID=UPI00237B5A3F|nr:UDP-2,3-diacylglucosamine diphosphatase LpxI [Mesorhizobium shangrilense]
MSKTSERRATVRLSAPDKVAVVAGGGRLPVNVAEGLRALGHDPFVVLIEGETDADSRLDRFEHRTMSLEDAGALRGLLKRRKVTHVVLAGSIDRRPSLGSYKLNLGLLAALPRLSRALKRGDDGMLRLLIEHIEAAGMKVVGAHEIVPDLLALEGSLTAVQPLPDDWRDLEAAREAALAIGALDIGQAAISVNGRVIALEGIEGTDGLLERARELRTHGRIAKLKRGVIVKCAKPDQEVRADLPAIGPATVDGAHAAGLAGIGVEAGRSLILDWAKVIERADALGLFVVGLKSDREP